MKITGTDKLKKLAARVRDVPKAGERAMHRAINTTAVKVQTMAVKDITSQLSLKSSYVRGLFSIRKANASSMEAFVLARVRPVRLFRFNPRQLTAFASRARGDTRRGIPAEFKHAGMSVQVSPENGRKTMKRAFILPLRAGTEAAGNGWGIFVRTGKGAADVKHLYGPSPDQLFRRWRREQAPSVSLMLAQAYASQLRYELTGKRN